MTRTNQYCDCCKCLLIEDGQNIKHKNGFCAEIGYSIGGWGSRTNIIPVITVELCDDCFGQVRDKSKELFDLFLKLKKQNAKQNAF